MEKRRLSNCEKLVEARKRGGSGGSAFKENMRRLVGNVDPTPLWVDSWLGERSLKDVFPRLYRVARDKDAVVSERYRLEGGRAQWHFDFRRNLRDFENEYLVGMQPLLWDFPLSIEEEDELIWTWESSGVFSVRSMVGRINNSSNEFLLPGVTWKNLAPLRVHAFL